MVTKNYAGKMLRKESENKDLWLCIDAENI